MRPSCGLRFGLGGGMFHKIRKKCKIGVSFSVC